MAQYNELSRALTLPAELPNLLDQFVIKVTYIDTFDDDIADDYSDDLDALQSLLQMGFLSHPFAPNTDAQIEFGTDGDRTITLTASLQNTSNAVLIILLRLIYNVNSTEPGAGENLLALLGPEDFEALDFKEVHFSETIEKIELLGVAASPAAQTVPFTAQRPNIPHHAPETINTIDTLREEHDELLAFPLTTNTLNEDLEDSFLILSGLGCFNSLDTILSKDALGEEEFFASSHGAEPALVISNYFGEAAFLLGLMDIITEGDGAALSFIARE